ncbi:MAG: helix-turn-helix domain-containing protein [Deltaproteobacteria bacterium]|nr:helix-turn-helix domain-containing protein [Deltaproteobacteria bacterium]
MATQAKLIRKKQSIIELTDFLNNISQVCRLNDYSRQHFYDIKIAYKEHGIEGLKEKS